MPKPIHKLIDDVRDNQSILVVAINKDFHVNAKRKKKNHHVLRIKLEISTKHCSVAHAQNTHKIIQIVQLI